jgi:hypothetical protein
MMDRTIILWERIYPIDKNIVVNRTKQTPWPLVRKRSIPTSDRHLSTKLLPTFVDRRVSRGLLGGSPTVVNLSFLDRTRYLSFK